MSKEEEPKTTEAPSSEPLQDEDIILPNEEIEAPPEEPLVVPPDKPWIKEWITDMRLEWLRQKVCIGLNMPRSVFNTVIQTEEGSKQIRSFLDGTLPCLLFYPNEIVTIVETIVEPPPPPPPPPPSPPPTEEKPEGEEGEGSEAPVNEEASKPKEDAKGKKGKDDKKKDKKGDKKGGKKDKKGDKKGKGGGKKEKEEAPPEVEPEKKAEEGLAKGSEEATEGGSGEGGVAPNEEPKIEEPPKPQIVYTEKRDPILCASTGALPEEALSKHLVYFLKMKSGSLTEEQLDHDLESGVLPTGPGMSALEKVM